MTTTPYRLCTIEQVEPGSVVEHDLAPFVVDELRRNADGWGVLGWPNHRVGHGRREAFTVKPGDEVKVLGVGDVGADLTAIVLDAIRDYASEWQDRRDPEDVRPLDAGTTELLVRQGGHVWRVPLPW